MNEEQRAAIKFCVRNGLTKRKTIEMIINAYGESSVKKTAIYKWYKRFEDGRENLGDNERHGRPVMKTSSDVAAVKHLVDKDRRITIRDIVDRTSCSYGTVFNIIHDKLNMRRVCARWIPKLLSDDQKRQRIQSCERLLNRFEREGSDFMERIVTVDETWISLYTPETKSQSSMWKTPGSPSPKKFRVTQSTRKQMFVVFFDCRGVILTYGVPPGQTVDAAYYSKVLSRDFLRAMRKKREAYLPSIVFRQDNAPSHRAAATQSTIEKLGFELLDQTPYSPDLSPCYFFLFPLIKSFLRGTHFGDTADLSAAVQVAISNIHADTFRKCFIDSWVTRCRKFIMLGGAYFEKDTVK